MRSRRGAVRWFVALGATACVHVALAVFGGGCGQFGVSGEAADSGASAEAMTGDDGAPPVEASSADVDADAGVPDATCGAHDFCADFEQPTPQDGWSLEHTFGGGALAIAPGVGTPGNALRSSVEMQAAPQYGYLTKDFPGAKGIHVELEINVPATQLESSTVLTLVQFSGAASSESGVDIQFASNPSTISFFVAHGDGNSAYIPTAIAVPRATWVHLVLEMRFGSNQALSLSIDGMVSDQVISTIAPTAGTELRVGLQHYTGQTPAIAVLYDTVRADILQ